MQNTSFFMNSCRKYANPPELFTCRRLAPGWRLGLWGKLHPRPPAAWHGYYLKLFHCILLLTQMIAHVRDSITITAERTHCIPQGTEQDPLTNHRDAAPEVTVTSHVHLGSPQCLDHNTELMRTNWQQNTVHFHCKPNGDLREHTLMR